MWACAPTCAQNRRNSDGGPKPIMSKELTGPRMLTITADRLVADPIGALWADGLASIPTRGLEAFGDTDASVLTAGCLADPDALVAFDDRAAQAMSVLRPHLR